MAQTHNGTKAETKEQIYKKVTVQIMQSMISSGTLPWRQTWFDREGKPLFYNPVTKTRYKLLNRLLLGKPGQYITFKQAKEHGGHVKKGAKGHLITYWSEFIPAADKALKEELEAKGEDWSHLKKYTLKYYYVYDVNDIENLNLKQKEQEEPEMQEAISPVDYADLVLLGYRNEEGVKLDEKQGNKPSYVTDTDTVTIPRREQFVYEEDYYASLFSQMVHSTAREDRCDRKAEYEALQDGDVTTKEELVADIASSMILSVTGISRKETTNQLKAQIQKYVAAMENDSRLIISASTKAQSAADLILGKYAVE